MEDREVNEGEMSFLGHLEELRWRLVRAAIATVVVSLLMFAFIDELFEYVILPLKSDSFITYRAFNSLGHWLGLEEDMFKKLNFGIQNVEMIGQFTTHLTVSLMGGLILAFPFIIYQIWQFVKPGLREQELNSSKNVVLYSSILMILGILFGYFLVSPLSIHFFGSYNVSDQVQNDIRLGSYISMVVRTTFYSGLMFQLPVVIYILTKMGVISSELLKKFRKHAIVVILLISAIITPPDMVTQILVGIPVYILYEIGIVVTKRVEKSRGY